MFLFSSVWAFMALPLLASAHFHLMFPKSRGFSDDSISKYPCGGFDTPLSERTEFPISGGPVWINNQHTSSLVQVVLALGDNPSGDDFVHNMLSPVSENGPGNLCVKNLAPPNDTSIKPGTKGTIMVVTSGEGSLAGLYACGDVVFVDKKLSEDEINKNCKMSPGVQVSKSDAANANGTKTSGNSSPQPSSDKEGGAPSVPSLAAAGTALVLAAFTGLFSFL